MSETAESQKPLVEALKGVGLNFLAQRAANNEFHDYLTPHAMPQHVLVSVLHKCSQTYPGMASAILKIRQDVIEGKYDATKEESEAWANSPEGKETMRQLMNANKKLK